jgi:hypothetical protein
VKQAANRWSKLEHKWMTCELNALEYALRIFCVVMKLNFLVRDVKIGRSHHAVLVNA